MAQDLLPAISSLTPQVFSSVRSVCLSRIDKGKGHSFNTSHPGLDVMTSDIRVDSVWMNYNTDSCNRFVCTGCLPVFGIHRLKPRSRWDALGLQPSVLMQQPVPGVNPFQAAAATRGLESQDTQREMDFNL